MPNSSNATTVERKRPLRSQKQSKSTDKDDGERSEAFLTIESALPPDDKRKLYRRSHSTLLNPTTSLSKSCDYANVETRPDGTVHITRNQSERDSQPDRISLDRRGLTSFPVIDGEMRLRLLSLQHNLVCNLDGLKTQNFPCLVFLDIYDNQLEHLTCLDSLDNLRVLLVGKNRLKKIEGLNLLKKIEVLDLHGNQINHVTGLSNLTDLKVLNLAGNQIRSIGTADFQGLISLQELNLRRNRIKKLLGFGETPNLTKLFISNNDLQSVEDVSSLAKSSNLKEVAIDSNPVFLEGDCVSFLVSYLPQLSKLNAMQVTDQVRKAAMAWRRNKETSNSAFMDLTSDVCLNVRREEIISNARTNWELLRSQTRCLTVKTQPSKTPLKFSSDSDLILTSFGNFRPKSRVPRLVNRKLSARTNSQDTDNSHTSSSSTANSEFIKLPPILVPIIKKMEKSDGAVKLSGSLSSIGPNFDSSVSSLGSENDRSTSPMTSSSSASSSSEDTNREEVKTPEITKTTSFSEKKPVVPAEITAANDVGNAEISTPITLGSGSDSSVKNPPLGGKLPRTVKSAVNARTVSSKWQTRAQTAKKKQTHDENGGKDREQGGDYLIEICGRHLNVYGQCALRFIDRSWNSAKANDVTTVKFNYVNFNGIAAILNKLKSRFPNVEHFVFKETNIQTLGQLNALAEVQGLSSIFIDSEGNPICRKNWESYAIYRLSHWGLNVINDRKISEDDVKKANDEYQSLSDLVLWSLPDVLLQPLLVRLRLDVRHGISEQNAKKWLISADPELRSVVSKEALQYKKVTGCQEDAVFKQRAKSHISQLLEEMSNSVDKLRILDKKWPQILHEFVRNTLLDYSQLEMYMKQKILELK